MLEYLLEGRRALRALVALTLGLSLGFLPGCLAPRATTTVTAGLLPRHHTLVLEQPVLAPDSSYGETRWLASPIPFDQVLVSWNVDVMETSGVIFSLQVRRASGVLSPWLDIGDWGVVDPARSRVIDFADGRVDVDTLILNQASMAADPGLEVRVRMRSVGPDAAQLAQLAVTFSDRYGRMTPAPDAERWEMPGESVARLSIPFRSQRATAPSLSARVCSPTSVNMLLASVGSSLPIERVAALAYDSHHDLYGVWPRSIQTAYALGLPGFLTRFEGWGPVHGLLELGVPIVISIKAAPGELANAPYDQTDGHLLVLAGVDEGGDLLVQDPAAVDIFSGVTTYSRLDLERCWLANGGTAYVFVAPDQSLPEILALL
ncbi:MAG: hypothetical protein ACI8QS_001973 [Planctomycetota bacterium]|jgi:hypothetical protein